MIKGPATLSSTKTIFFLSVIVFAISIPSILTGQPGPAVFAGGGATWYYGDMNDRVICHEKLFSHYLTAGLLFPLSPKFSLSIAGVSGEVEGADSLAIQDFNRKRNLHFKTDLQQFAIHIEYSPFHFRGSGRSKVKPYLLAGIAWYQFNPVAVINGIETELQPVGTEGQFIAENGYPEPYRLERLSMPLGIGVDIGISRVLSARVEVISHFTFFDYFDDVGGVYADSAKLAATGNGTLAIQLAGHNDTDYPDAGMQRGSSGSFDSYVFAGVKLLYAPFAGNKFKGGAGGRNNGNGHRKKKDRKACPAYR